MFWLYKAVEKILVGVLFQPVYSSGDFGFLFLVSLRQGGIQRFHPFFDFGQAGLLFFQGGGFFRFIEDDFFGLPSPFWFDGLQNQGKDSSDDNGYTLTVGMDTVGLVEGGVADHTVEKKGVEGNVMFAGQAGVDGVEAVIIVGAEVARGAHADKHGGHAFLFKPGEDGVEVGGGFVRRKATQSIIGAQFDDDQLRIVGEGPVQTGQATGGGIARDSGVGDVDIEPLAAQRRLQLRRKGLGGGQTQAGGETVAEHGNA